VKSDKPWVGCNVDEFRVGLKFKSSWTAPSFTVIPNISIVIPDAIKEHTGDHSQPACAKPFINFCPNCFTRSPITKHTERGRVFVRTEVRYGSYVPQIHVCGERVDA
jgi:hypothetical protein